MLFRSSSTPPRDVSAERPQYGAPGRPRKLRLQDACAAHPAEGGTDRCLGGGQRKARPAAGPASPGASACPDHGKRALRPGRWGFSGTPGSRPAAGATARRGAENRGSTLARRFFTVFVAAKPFLFSNPGMKQMAAWNRGKRDGAEGRERVGVAQRLPFCKV